MRGNRGLGPGEGTTTLTDGTQTAVLNLKALVNVQFPSAVDVSVPYLKLKEDENSKVRYFVAELRYKKKPQDWLYSTATARVEADSGQVVEFKDGYHYETWD